MRGRHRSRQIFKERAGGKRLKVDPNGRLNIMRSTWGEAERLILALLAREGGDVVGGIAAFVFLV